MDEKEKTPKVAPKTKTKARLALEEYKVSRSSKAQIALLEAIVKELE